VNLLKFKSLNVLKVKLCMNKVKNTLSEFHYT